MTDTDSLFPFRFQLPEGFHPINLAATTDERIQSTYNRLRAVVPSWSDEQHLEATAAAAVAVETMLANGVVYAATFLGRSERVPNSATMANFTVAVHPPESRSARQPEEIVNILRQHRRNAKCALVDLPIGRCVATIEDDILSATPEPSEKRYTVRQIQLIHPMGGLGKIACFAMATQFVDDWEDYQAIMANICKSIRWVSREGSSGIGSVLDGG